MTRSTHTGGVPRRTAFTKMARQTAHREGLCFREALNKTKGVEAFYSSNLSYTERRNPGRMDGVQWNSSAFICGSKVDDGELREEDVDFNFMDTRDTRHHTDMSISLLDIARPAKQKGVAKDFEVVQKVRNVIALEDDFEGIGYQWEDDEWEQIYDDQHAEEKKSYSSVLKGNET